MSGSYRFGVLARAASEHHLIAHYRSRDTDARIEEALAVWRDRQAGQFASGFSEVQSASYGPIMRSLSGLSDGLKAMQVTASECEESCGQVHTEAEALEQLWLNCQNHLQASASHAAEASNLADHVEITSKSVKGRILSLGQPPI
jgi:hypothetical protein